MPGRRVIRYNFTIGTGSATTTVEFNTDDWSRLQGLLCILKLTTIGTDAVDTLDVKIQNTFDRVSWNTVARFPAVAGNTVASAAAPRVYRLNLQNGIALEAPEESYEETGSSGTEIAAGSVRNGPFPGVYRDTSGRAPSWRALFVRTDADADASWIGSLDIISAPSDTGAA